MFCLIEQQGDYKGWQQRCSRPKGLSIAGMKRLSGER